MKPKYKLASVFILICILAFSSGEGEVVIEIREAVATISGANGTAATVKFRQEGASNDVIITGTVNVTAPLDVMIGLHIHEYGDMSSKDCTSVKKHWNPREMTHGDINSTIRHVGDLGNVNVSVDGDGIIHFQLPAEALPLVGPESIVGRALVIHQNRDDLGEGVHSDSNSTGHAGYRLGCGVIGLTTEFSSATLDPGMQPGRSRARIRRAVAVIRSPSGIMQFGSVQFVAESGDLYMRITGSLHGILPTDTKHAIHVHPFGTVNCAAAGGIMGDMGNVDVDSKGSAYISLVVDTEKFPLVGPKSIIGRTLVLHQGARDNSGSRLGCGIIGVVSDFSPADTDSPV